MQFFSHKDTKFVTANGGKSSSNHQTRDVPKKLLKLFLQNLISDHPEIPL